MLRICIHIERLLLRNNCVVLPDFGGFMVQTHPPVIQPSESEFRPPYREIVFNSSLKHADDLFLMSYMQEYQIDRLTAANMLQEDMQQLRNELNTKDDVLIGRLGLFRKKDQRILFEPSPNKQSYNLHLYGLDAFSLPPVDCPIETPELFLEPEAPFRPSQASLAGSWLLQAAGASAAAVLLFLLISTPVKDTATQAYKASFLPTALNQEMSRTNQQGTIVADTAHLSDSVQPRIVHQTTPLTQITDSVQPAKMYYVIVGSFNSQKQAEQFFAAMEPLKTSGVVKHGTKVRVYANKFSDRTEAEKCMRTLRAETKYKDCWMFIEK